MTVLNGNHVEAKQIYEQMGKIKANPNNSLRNLTYQVSSDGNLEVDFRTVSNGTMREICGSIAGNLSKALGGGFKLPKMKKQKRK